MSNREAGPILTFTTPCVVGAVVGVAISAVWGLDWRWIPTTILAGIVILFLASVIDSWRQKRTQGAQW